MKKFLFLVVLCLLQVSLCDAQKLLNVEETTEGIGVYPCHDRHEALVVFICHENFDLAFESNYDSELAVSVDSTAGTKNYRIVFITQAPGVSYEGRRLTIKAEGFKDFTLPLNLRDKQKFEYTVSDPYSVLRSPFFLYQEKANELFYSGDYQRAKDNYMLVKACPEYENDNNKKIVDDYVALCDSMIEWGTIANEYERFAQFGKAYSYYLKMLRVNSSSEDIRTRIVECNTKYLSDCEAELTLAEHYMKQKEYEKAQESYQHIIDKDCNQAPLAAVQLSNVRTMIRRKKAHSRCFMYDYTDNMPIGFTYALCHYEKSGGYFSLHFNKDVIDVASGKSFCDGLYNPDNTEHPFTYNEGAFDKFDSEIAVSFGWTINIWNPIFIHFGPGYHGGGLNMFDSEAYKDLDLGADDFNSTTTKNKNKSTRIEWYNAVAPEVGLILKAWRLSAKITYQYNYWINEEDDDVYKDLFETSKLSFGLGFCW